MEEIMNDKWISIDEAAEYLGIKTVTLRSWIRNGKEDLPAPCLMIFFDFPHESVSAFTALNPFIEFGNFKLPLFSDFLSRQTFFTISNPAAKSNGFDS